MQEGRRIRNKRNCMKNKRSKSQNSRERAKIELQRAYKLTHSELEKAENSIPKLKKKDTEIKIVF